MQRSRQRQKSGGFTLAELAIVLVIISLLLGGLMVPLATQNDLRQHERTNAIMNEARDAMDGFVLINDRVPCPAPSALADEAPHGGPCAAQTGFFPAVALGVPGNDAWGRPLRYAVATMAWNTDTPAVTQPYPATIPGGILAAGIPADKLRTDLGACSPGTRHSNVVTGLVLTCPPADRLVSDRIGAVIWSDGADSTTTADDVVTWTAWPTLGGMIARLP